MDHHGDPNLSARTMKEQQLEMLAGLLASTLDGQATAADVRRALSRSEHHSSNNNNDDDDDDDAWRVRVAEYVHARQSVDGAETGPSSTTVAVAVPTSTMSSTTAATQEWVCPMCETVNWAPDPRKSLRRRHESNAAAPFSSTQLRCACCGYDGSLKKEEADTEGRA